MQRRSLILWFLFLLLNAFSLSAQNGRYDLRFDLHEINCSDSLMFVDIEVRAHADTNTFAIAGQNYRFSFNRAAVDSPHIEMELTLSGPVIAPNGFSLYYPHSLTGSIDTIVSYNVAFATGPGYPVSDTAWTEVGRLVFSIVDFYECVNLRWHTQAPADFPNTIITEKVGVNEIAVDEGSYFNLNFCFADSCAVNDPPIALNDFNTTVIATPVSGNVLPNDTDPEGDSLIVQSMPVISPSSGSLNLDPLGNYTYSPIAAFAGKDSFLYNVCDSGLPTQCDQAWVKIRVDSCKAPATLSLPSAFCVGDTIPLSATLVSGAATYSWSLPAGASILSGQGTAAIMAAWGNSTGNVCVTAQTGNCVSPPQCKMLQPMPLPGPAGLIAGPDSVCPGKLNVFSIPQVPGATGYSWSLPSGWTIKNGAGTNQVSVLTTASAGSVCVTATNNCGSIQPICMPVWIESLPTAAFGWTTSGLQLQFTDNSTGATSWQWDFGDGNTGSGANPVHSYSAGGTYTVCLMATGTCGTDSECQTLVLTATSVSDLSLALAFRIYPNPASDKFFLSFQSEIRKELHLCLFDLSGKRIRESDFPAFPNEKDIEFDVSGIPEGLYLLRISAGGQNWTQKLWILSGG
jgi:hypothetical protein